MKNILVIDGDAGRLNGITENLKKKKFPVSGFGSLKDAEEYLREAEPAVIFLSLPEGLKKKHLKLLKKKAPIIGVLKRESESIIQKAIASGIEDFIVPPYTPARLKFKIDCCMLRKRRIESLERDRKHFKAVAEISSLASSTLNPQEILYLIVKKIAEIIPVVRCSMIRVDKEHNYAYVVATFESPRLKTITLDLNKYPEIRESLATRNPVIINDVKTDPIMMDVREVLAPMGIKSIVVLPVFYKDTIIGTLFLRTSRSGKSFAEDEIMFCNTIANASANALYSAFLYEKSESEKVRLGKLAITDYLTGLYNTRYLYHRLAEEFSRSQRYNIPLTCLMADIDLFKRINDTYGHKTGDEVLKEFTAVLKKNVRKSDILARYGGEEFIILLPNTSRDGSISEAERLSACIKKHNFKSMHGEQSISISVGAVTYPHKRITMGDDLITLADTALLKAKNKGRGSIFVYQ